MKPSIKERWTPFKVAYSPSSSSDEVYVNKTHTVLIHFSNKSLKNPMDGWVTLSIKRNDRRAECDWRILQRIKNEIVGENREGVQLFPSMERILDTANQYFIYIAPKGYVIGLGQMEREVSDETYAQKVGAIQRPFDEDDPIKNFIDNSERSERVDVFPLPLYPKE